MFYYLLCYYYYYYCYCYNYLASNHGAHWWRNTATRLLPLFWHVGLVLSTNFLLNGSGPHYASAEYTNWLETIGANGGATSGIGTKVQDTHLSKTIHSTSAQPILGITASNTDPQRAHNNHTIAIALTDLIQIIDAYRTTDPESLVTVHHWQSLSIPLPAPINDHILEFKFLNDNQIFYCDSKLCRSCKLSNTSSCVKYNLKQKGVDIARLEYVTATSDPVGRITLRYVSNNLKNAGILKYAEPNELNKSADPLQISDDIDIIEGHELATAFDRKGFTFFVGSAQRSFEPYVNAKLSNEISVMSLRITRVCNADQTDKLESRIDMALACGNITALTNVYSLAAEYHEATDELIVVQQALSNAELHKNIVCKFDVNLINLAFDNIWQTCQSVNYKHHSMRCFAAGTIEDLPLHCYIFTRLASAHGMRICSQFGGSKAKKKYDNCDLHSFDQAYFRFGWLEEFLPFQGDLLAVLPDFADDILSVSKIDGDDAVFTFNPSGVISRVSNMINASHSRLMWSFHLPHQTLLKNKYNFVVDRQGKGLYYIDNNQVKFDTLSCSTFYQSCESLEAAIWSDPLRCYWCTLGGNSGYSVGSNELFKCASNAVSSVCSPYIEHINTLSTSVGTTSTFEVYGGRFDRLENIQIKVCNHTCAIIKLSPIKFSCIVDLPYQRTVTCNLLLKAAFGSAGPLNLTYTLNGKAKADNVLSTAHSHFTRRTKGMFSIIAVVVLSMLIIFICWFVRRYLKKQRLKMKHQCNGSSQLTLNHNHSMSTYQGLIKSNGYQMKMFKPYESLFMEIDPKLKIPLDEIEFGDEIGKGNFGVVYRAIYQRRDAKPLDVACKTIDSQTDGVVSGVSEFLREGLIMANFDHVNVARLIGISITENNCPIIISDYLANGDLRHYIINPGNKLTFGRLLDFGIQIAQGMQYLHEKNFIHRDLAARNCMLDANFTVKIADFGLSRDVSRCGMYQAVNKNRGIPIRWMPIESLEAHQYTFKADVWAYGVVLWELATRGLVPYADLKFIEILRLLKNGHRLSKPKGCPDVLYENLMLICWMDDPQRRPTFFELSDMMEDIVEQLRNGAPSGHALLNSHYERVSPRSSATTPIIYSKCGAQQTTTTTTTQTAAETDGVDDYNQSAH